MTKLCFSYDNQTEEITIGYEQNQKWIPRLGTDDKRMGIAKLRKYSAPAPVCLITLPV